MKTPYVIMESGKTKKSALFQEGLRRLNNCSLDLEWKEKAMFLSELSWKMMISGYSGSSRYQVIKGVIERHKDMVEQYRGGTFTLYRTRLEIQQAKQLKGGNTAATWFLRGENTCTIKVAATPGGALKKEMVKTLENVRAPDGGLTKVVEKGGKPVMGGLQQSDPFKPDGCRFGDSDCLVAQGADCNTMSAVYAITCNSCKERLEVSPSQLSPASSAV